MDVNGHGHNVNGNGQDEVVVRDDVSVKGLRRLHLVRVREAGAGGLGGGGAADPNPAPLQPGEGWVGEVMGRWGVEKVEVWFWYEVEGMEHLRVYWRTPHLASPHFASKIGGGMEGG